MLLIEEGPVVIPDDVALLARQQEARAGSLVRRIAADREEDPSGTVLLSGRVIGGGWSINHGVMVGPTSADLRALHEASGRSAAWEPSVVRDRIARRVEDVDGSDRGVRTAAALAAGRVPMLRTHRDGDPIPPAAESLLAAAARNGLPYLDDIDRTDDPTGSCSYRISAVDGRRYSAASVLLDAQRCPPSLALLGDTVARRVLVDRGSAVGVEVEAADGGARRIAAGLVVVCTGALHTPELLHRSGIGDPERLAAAGIAVRHELAGVGEGLLDHARIEVPLAMVPHADDEGRRFGDALRLHLRVRTSAATADADVDLSVRHPRGRASLMLMVKLLEQRAVGHVRPGAGGGSHRSDVRTGLARSDADAAALVEGAHIGVGILLDTALRGRYRREVGPPTAEDVRRSRRSTGDMVGTCRMGASGDRGSVVDASLMVHGLDRFMIADASVIPVLPHAGPTPTVVAVAEHAVDVVAGASP